MSRPLRAFVSGYTVESMTSLDLEKALKSRYPAIKEVKFPSRVKHWSGFAFVDFKIREDFLNFVAEKRVRLPEFSMNLLIKPHKQGKALKRYLKDIKRRKLRVTNIPSTWDDERLEAAFIRFGSVENCYVERIKSSDSWQEDSDDSLAGTVIFFRRISASECFLEGRIRLQDQNDGGRSVELAVCYKDEGYHQKQVTKVLNGEEGGSFHGEEVTPAAIMKARRKMAANLGKSKETIPAKGKAMLLKSSQRKPDLDIMKEVESEMRLMDTKFHQIKPGQRKYHQVSRPHFAKEDRDFGNYRVNLQRRSRILEFKCYLPPSR